MKQTKQKRAHRPRNPKPKVEMNQLKLRLNKDRVRVTMLLNKRVKGIKLQQEKALGTKHQLENHQNRKVKAIKHLLEKVLGIKHPEARVQKKKKKKRKSQRRKVKREKRRIPKSLQNLKKKCFTAIVRISLKNKKIMRREQSHFIIYHKSLRNVL